MNEDSLHDVVAVEARGGHRLFLRFEDGVEGEVDLRDVLRTFTGVFAPLKDPAYVALVQVSEEVGTVFWPNDADIAPETLYRAVQGARVRIAESAESTPKRAPSRRARRGTSARRGKTRRGAGR